MGWALLDRHLAASPPEQRAAARAVVASICGEPTEVEAVTGGASGAAILKVTAPRARYLLRVEGPDHPMLRRNPHRFIAERAAADGGIAPPVHAMDEAHGVVLSAFVERRPLASYPGGPAGLAFATGELLARLQALPPFPALVDYADLVEGMLKAIAASRLFVLGALDPHLDRLAQLRGAMADDLARVASHNDPNPRNILFDGERLWLIDWESAYGNRPAFDAAIVLDNLAPTPELEAGFLRGWGGRPLDRAAHARLQAARAMSRLYYACFVLQLALTAPESGPHTLATPSPAEIGRAIVERELQPMTPALALQLGMMLLSAFMTEGPFPGIGETVALSMFGPGRGLDGL